ncbi:HD domain-containing protein [Faecalibacter macacae]|uniref:HD domain-containing protein n=1 Tax=Faecalibacter macacae TaxID=1859289 RepID=A0A3L9M0D4_9FLAO|nr:HD domain-containing protein [Faecalibacter macacae]RLZ06435.1 HD domain-containing protein [Faecalibacter macacae]
MNKNEILKEVQSYIRKTFLEEGTGHDYFHIERVVTNAKKIVEKESADSFLVELAAWVHDIGDYKLHGGVDKSEELIKSFLESINLDEEIISKVNEIVSQVSFSKGNKPTTIEAEIVQDADRLDAIGAVGIARCFAYGGSTGNILFNPEDNSKNASSIQHFYDKLFKLKDLMNTTTAKEIAEERHAYMKSFVQQFYNEVNFK